MFWICGVKFGLLRRNLLKFKYFINGDFRLLVGKIYSRGDGFDDAISARLNLSALRKVSRNKRIFWHK